MATARAAAARTRQPAQGMGLVRALLELIKVEHSLFALPFVYAGTLLALWTTSAEGTALVELLRPSLLPFLWILIAAVGARTAAMALNRIIDRDLDAHNPRTSSRALVTGEVTVAQSAALVIIGTAALLLAAWQLNPLCLLLSPIPLAFFVAYPYTKRVTVGSHLFLGATLGMAPLGGWLAITGSLTGLMPALLLAAAMGAWVAGFDIIYALQDITTDREQGLYSMPARLGVERALWVTAALHALTLAGLVALWVFLPLADVGLIGVAGIGATLGWELANATDTRRAFFLANVLVSSLFFVSVLLGVAL